MLNMNVVQTRVYLHPSLCQSDWAASNNWKNNETTRYPTKRSRR